MCFGSGGLSEGSYIYCIYSHSFPHQVISLNKSESHNLFVDECGYNVPLSVSTGGWWGRKRRRVCSLAFWLVGTEKARISPLVMCVILCLPQTHKYTHLSGQNKLQKASCDSCTTKHARHASPCAPFSTVFFFLTVRDVKVRQIPPKPLSDRAKKMSAEKTRTKGANHHYTIKMCSWTTRNCGNDFEVTNQMCCVFCIQ